MRRGLLRPATRLGLWTALAWLAGGCTGTETGNPSFSGRLGYDAYSSAPGVVALSAALSGENEREPSSELSVANAWLVLGDVELLEGAECASQGAHVHGLGAGDHAAGQAPSTEFELTAGRYCGVRLPLQVGGSDIPAEAPESLHAESVVLRGQLADGRAFELHSRLQEELVLRATDGDFAIDGAHAAVVIGFDVASWLGGLSWQDADVASDGTVWVDADRNPDLLAQFEAALPDGVALFSDADADGLLDAEPMQLAHAEH